MDSSASWTIAALCRKSDPDRMPKFFGALDSLKASGSIGDMDDGPEQTPIPPGEMERSLLSLLPGHSFESILTHGPWGEYTRHRRHEETGCAVLALWKSGRLKANNVFLFAYEDGEESYLPRLIPGAHRVATLPESIWEEKYRIITEIYGFSPESWEARTTPKTEAFWCCRNPAESEHWLRGGKDS